MRPSLRFLALAVVGWAGFRAATLGSLPNFSPITHSEAKPAPAIVPTQFPEFSEMGPSAPAELPIPAAYPAPSPVQYVQGVLGVPVAMRRGVVSVYQLPPAGTVAALPMPRGRSAIATLMPTPTAALYPQLPPIDPWPLASLAAVSRPLSQSSVVLPAQSRPVDPRAFDRVQLSAWALLRGQRGQPLGPTSLASGGQLGGSQAGSRLTYYVTRQIAASFRTSTDVGRRGGEVAAGLRVQPVGGIPVWVTAERRQQLGHNGGGRNAFAIFAEGGLYQRPMPWQFSLDAYLQAGIVGMHSRDPFIDGALTLTRPIYKNFSAGLGIWGGAQPGLYRVDAGPRVTMAVRKNIRVHFDWRQRVAGNAAPGSGPAVTLAGDF